MVLTKLRQRAPVLVPRRHIFAHRLPHRRVQARGRLGRLATRDGVAAGALRLEGQRKAVKQLLQVGGLRRQCAGTTLCRQQAAARLQRRQRQLVRPCKRRDGDRGQVAQAGAGGSRGRPQAEKARGLPPARTSGGGAIVFLTNHGALQERQGGRRGVGDESRVDPRGLGQQQLRKHTLQALAGSSSNSRQPCRAASYNRRSSAGTWQLGRQPGASTLGCTQALSSNNHLRQLALP